MKKGALSVLMIMIAIGSLFLTGCARPMLESGNIEKNIAVGNYQLSEKELIKNKKNNLLWYLDTGIVSRYAEDYPASNKLFDKAERKIKQYNEMVLAGEIAANVGAVLTNDTVMTYEPKIYEGIMVNTYKGMNFLSESDFNDARVEFNRALERQRRAKEFFASEIKYKQKQTELKAKKVNADKIKKISNNKKTRDVIERRYSNLFAFKPYPNFINPFTSYMAGLFFMSAHEYAKATDLFKETYGMIKGDENAAAYVKKDLEYAIRRGSSIKNISKERFAWIIFANGKGISKKELRFDIPLFLVTHKAYYTGIALPMLKENRAAYSYLKIRDGVSVIKTKQVANMDTIIKTEFKKRFPAIMDRAVIRTVTQTILQYKMKKRMGLIGEFLGAVYQASMNRADTRQWKLLPKNFQIARVKLRTSELSISTPQNHKLVELRLNPHMNHIIFIMIPRRNAKVVYKEVSF